MFAVAWVGSGYDARQVQTLRLLPTTCQLASGNVWSDARFTVTNAGNVDFPQGVTYLSGRGATTLTAQGFPVRVDATRLSSPRFAIAWVGSGYDARQVQTFQLLPATYQLGDGATWSAARFTVTPTGTVDYAPAATYLSGRGTTALTILTNTLPPGP